MAIKMSRYVRIISSVTGASAVAQQELTGRRFTTDPRVPVGVIVAVQQGGAEDYFGTDSPEAAFARHYFSYISPAPASQARELQFVAYVDEARPSRIYGYQISARLTDFQAITNGSMNITVDGNAYNLTGIDLSGASSLSAVANAITAAIADEADGGTTAGVMPDVGE